MAKKEKPESLKVKAYKLFAKGYTQSSPEVKALGLKNSTRTSYYSQWLAAGKPGALDSPPEPPEDELIPQNKKAISEDELVITPSPEESTGDESAIDELSEITETESSDTSESESSENQSKKTGEDNPAEDEKYRGPNGKKLPTIVAGQGLNVAVVLSTKTIVLYQMAASMSSEELTLGDFLDTCVEDTYRGRGLDLGLVKLGGDGHGR